MPDKTRVMVVRCPECKKKAFKYLKVGRGKVIRCYKDRIRDDRTTHKQKAIYCPCGHRLALDRDDHWKISIPLRLD